MRIFFLTLCSLNSLETKTAHTKYKQQQQLLLLLLLLLLLHQQFRQLTRSEMEATIYCMVLKVSSYYLKWYRLDDCDVKFSIVFFFWFTDDIYFSPNFYKLISQNRTKTISSDRCSFHSNFMWQYSDTALIHSMNRSINTCCDAKSIERLIVIAEKM